MAISGGDGSIILTTKVDETGLKKGLGSMSKTAKSFGAGIAKSFAVIGAAAGAATVAITKMAVSAYADYEQLVGGVETLFKGSASKVMAYAEDAFFSAGVSANEYMRQVTSFSASLIRSTAGDTDKAADIANMALIDISDNVNKMGSSMESVTLAYQGFAKQQYMLLDNLKLGYGGTKTEMERLLKNAQALTGVKYDINNLADVYSAIHAIQTKLGITGTTAKEAEQTITGSANMMKAAWQNVLSAIAGGGDLDRAINNLVYSIQKYFENIVPVVERSLIGIGRLIEQVAPMLVQNVASALIQSIPSLLNAVYQMIIGLAKGIWQGIKALFTGGKAQIQKQVSTIGGGGGFSGGGISSGGAPSGTGGGGSGGSGAKGKSAEEEQIDAEIKAIQNKIKALQKENKQISKNDKANQKANKKQLASFDDISILQSNELSESNALIEKNNEEIDQLQEQLDLLRDKKQALKDVASASGSGISTPSIGGISGGGIGGFDFGIQSDVDTTPLETALDRIKGSLEPIQKIFMSGFWQGFQNADFSGIKQSISGIKKSLIGIFTSPEVQTSAQGFVSSVVLTSGQITGSVASIGTTISTNLLGGFNQYLQANAPFIQTSIANMFDASSGIVTSVGNMWSAFANIFSVFASENGQSLTANIISIFSNASLGITELALQTGADFINFLTQPIVENQEVLKTALDGILDVFSEISGDISSLVSDLFVEINALYDEHIKPLVDTITEVITNLVSKITEAFNTYILPVLQGFAEDFGVVVEEHIKPMFDKIFGFIGKVVDLVKPLIENVIQPLLTFLIDTFAPVIGGIFDTVGKIFNTLIATVSDVIGGIRDRFSGLIDFFVGIFTGDLEKAWEGLKTTFSGLFDGITSILKGALNIFIDVINGLITRINAAIGVINRIPGVDIPKIKKIPRLAQGTVVPPNREFLAVLGDNKKEHEIVSPLSTMKQAFTEAMLEMGGSFGGGNTEVVLEIDSREFGRAVVEQGNRENRRIGTRLVFE